MRTQEMLAKMPNKQYEYLRNLKEQIKRAREENQNKLAEQFKATARGYIKGMVDAGIVEDFKSVWCWFTL